MNYETTMSSPVGSDILMSEDDLSARRKRRWIIAGAVIGLLILAALALSYFRDESAAVKAAAAAEKDSQAQTVTVISPGSDTVVRAINASGTLAARRDTPVGVVGEGGQVSRVYVDAGDWVKQGQVLASIDRSVQSQQAAALQAQIGVANADLQLSQNELNRALQLVERGFISKADVDRKTATRDSARARVNVANAQVNEIRARNARLDIRAPVGGFVLERNVEPGQTVSAGSGTLFRLAKGGEMEMQALLGEADLASISAGVSATIIPVGSDRSFTGQVWQVSPTINPQTRQGIARIALPFDRALRPGGFANVTIKAGAVTAPLLPESAIQNDREGSYVYIIDKDNKAERRAITLGDVSEKGVAIVAGLNGTERVVLRAGGFLNPGVTVIPKLQKQ